MATSCQMPPVPEVEMVSLPGLALANFTMSSKVLNGDSPRTDQSASEEAACMMVQSSQDLLVVWPMTRTNLLKLAAPSSV